MTISQEVSTNDMTFVILDMITKKNELEAKRSALEKLPSTFSSRIAILTALIDGYDQAITRMGDEFLVACRKEDI